jgi:hypothetical protein
MSIHRIYSYRENTLLHIKKQPLKNGRLLLGNKRGRAISDPARISANSQIQLLIFIS